MTKTLIIGGAFAIVAPAAHAQADLADEARIDVTLADPGGLAKKTD